MIDILELASYRAEPLQKLVQFTDRISNSGYLNKWLDDAVIIDNYEPHTHRVILWWKESCRLYGSKLYCASVDIYREYLETGDIKFNIRHINEDGDILSEDESDIHWLDTTIAVVLSGFNSLEEKYTKANKGIY